jgi:uncharacterized protein (TIGR00725 family)
MRRRAIAVIGGGECDAHVYDAAFAIGRLIAQREAVLVTGGRTGVMEAASRGAREAGGLVVGILPDLDPETANDAVEIAIPTGMGQLRNGLVVAAADAVIAVGGEWGTLSEIGLAKKFGKPVVGYDTWKLDRDTLAEDAILCASTAAEAVEQAFASFER